MTIRKFIKKLFVTIIMIGIVLAAVLKVGYILICKVIVMIIFAVLAIRYWVGEDIRKAEEEKRGTWLFTLGFIGLTVLTMLAANIPGQVQRDQYLYLTKEHTEQLEKVLLREATADSERCIQWYEKQMLGIRNNKALGNPAMQTEDERRYKNRIDGKEVYRDPDTCTLRVKELKDGSTKDSVLINGPVGEIIAMRERIFYIDMEDHNVLKSVTYDGRKRKTWTKDPVKQFAVIGEYVICCTEDEKLIRCDMSTGKKKELADHIQYFFAGAKLYAQKGSKIVSVSYDGKEIRVFKKDVVMMDKKEDKIYYRRMDRKKEQMYVCDVDEEIIEALKIACAWEFVEKLPDTINSALGERGRGLSEGQAQRISIARAVLRNAPILLLDEATSALDVTTERKVLRNIIEQKPNKTCIVTTHRPSVLNMCQRVYRVMETKVTELDEEESSRMAMDF